MLKSAAGVLLLIRNSNCTWRSKNPKGIPTQSPGLRGTRYPGVTGSRNHNPEGVATRCDARREAGRNPVGVVTAEADGPRVARAAQPWALRWNPFGIADAYKEQAGAVALQNLAEVRRRVAVAIVSSPAFAPSYRKIKTRISAPKAMRYQPNRLKVWLRT